MDAHRPKLWWILTASCLLFLLIEGTAGSRHPRARRSNQDNTKVGTGEKSGEGDTVGSDRLSVVQESLVKERNESTGQETYGYPTETTTEITDLNFNATGTTQMSDREAKGAVIYAVIFLFLYTSSVGMLILYNVNHQKKISEHEEMKNAQKEYHRGQEMIELQKRAELYFQFKLLYGQESGSGTPPVDESETATPEQKKKRFFKSFSLREIPKFSKASSSPTAQKILNLSLQRNMATLPEFNKQRIKRPKRVTLRPKMERGLSFSPDSEEKATNENRKPKRQLSLVSPPSDESGGEEELATQTWHPGSMTQDDQKMLDDVRRMSKPGLPASTPPEVPRVYVLKKNLRKDRETASAEEIETMTSSV